MSESNKSNLILLHGALGSKSQFDLLKETLRDNFTVHALNFSGHGGLSIPDGGFSLELFEDDILTYFKENNIETAHVFGYSMGGYVALSLAGKYPKTFHSVFTLATKLEWSPEIAMKEQAMLNPEIILQKVPKFAEELSARHQPANWKQVLISTADFMNKLGNKNLDPDFFKKISCPVRLAVGDRDKMVSMNETVAVYKALPKGSLSVFPDTPHPFESVDLNRLVFEIKQFCD